MKNKQVRYIFKKYCHQLNNAAAKLFPSFNEESIHMFRVAFKKIRAFLRLLKMDEALLKKNKSMCHLKKAFRIMGLIRDLQLQCHQINLSNKTGKPQTYLLFLQKRVLFFKKSLLRIQSKKRITIRLTDFKKTVSFHVSNKKINKYVTLKYKIIHTVIHTKNISSNDLHMARKILKEGFYNTEMNNILSKRLYEQWFRNTLNESSFKELLTKLGDFQDLQVQFTMLHPNRMSDIALQDRNWLNNYRTELCRKKNALKHSLVQQLKERIH